jgi:hypothetical protein
MTTDHLRDEGAHLFDLALAKGLDAGRYMLLPDPDGPEYSRFRRGPNFDQPPTGTQHEVWGQNVIDRLLAKRK